MKYVKDGYKMMTFNIKQNEWSVDYVKENK